jgi:nucleoside-diphosphate-sugar epimerase
MSPTRVLVTGGSGRLGRFVVAEARRHSEVTVLDLVAPSVDVAYVIADIRNLDALCEVVNGHDAIIHLAGLDSGVPASEHDYFHVNVQGTWNILAAAETAGISRTVVCSSIAAYGLESTPLQRRPDRLPFDEAHPLRPCSAYELSKQVVEVVAAAFARRTGMIIPCLRPAWVIFSDRVDDFDRRAREADGGTPPAAGHRPPPPHRAYVRPDDTARAFQLALTVDLKPFEAFNIGASDTMSPAPTLEVMARIYGCDVPVPNRSVFQAAPRTAIFGNARARQRLGWEPTSDWESFVANPPTAI